MLVLRILKDPYVLGISEDAVERELKRALFDRIREFLLELGVRLSPPGGGLSSSSQTESPPLQAQDGPPCAGCNWVEHQALPPSPAS